MELAITILIALAAFGGAGWGAGGAGLVAALAEDVAAHGPGTGGARGLGDGLRALRIGPGEVAGEADLEISGLDDLI